MKKTSILFIIFLTSNILLSYFSLPLEARLWIGLVGLAFPVVWSLQKKEMDRGKFLDQKDFLPPIPIGGWFLVFALAAAARFSRLTTLFVWPNFDESSYGFDAFQLADHGGPRLFYGVSQAPPLFIWGLGVFFKAFGASLTTLWFFPALVSLAAVPLAYLASRVYFSRSFSFVCAALSALAFWPVFVGRFALMTILILPAECLALWGMGRFLRASAPRAQKKSAVILGLIWGLGCYTHLHWPVVIALTGLPVMVWLIQHFKKNPRMAAGLTARILGSAFFPVLPLLIGAYREHYGGYLQHLWAFNETFSFPRQIQVWLSCLTSPFWGMDTQVHTYQPEWGGFLNPVLTSLFFIGALEIASRFQRPLYRWLLAGFILCLLPGLLTQDMETFRLFPIVPLLLIGVSLGLTRLMRPSAPLQNLMILSLLFFPSLAFDSYHLFGAYHHIWDQPKTWGFYTKSVGRYRAYEILEDWKARKGTGIIFPDFVQGLPDQSLSVAVHDFNASQNPGLDPEAAHWAAILTNVNYQPFLKARFPDGVAYGLSKDLTPADGGWMLFVFSLDAGRLSAMKAWIKAERALEPFIDQNLCYVMGQSFEDNLKTLSQAEGAFRGDPFLRSVYLEKKSDLETKQGLTLPNTAPPLPSADPVATLETAVAEGYPAAHLYEHLGALRLMRGQPLLAQKAFEKALRAPLNLTDSVGFLESLKSSLSVKRSP